MDKLPNELWGLIVSWVARMPERPTTARSICPPTICSLRLCSREMAALASPELFSHVVLSGDELDRLQMFSETIAPKYGSHIRNMIALLHRRSLGRNSSTDSEDSEDDDDDDESAPTDEEKEIMRKNLSTFARAIPHLTRLVDFRLDIAAGNPPLGLSPSDDPLAVAAATIGKSIKHLHCTRQGVGDPSIDPAYLASIISRMPNLETLELTAVATGETTADEDALFDSMRGLEHLTSLSLLFSDCFNGRLGEGEWKAPIQSMQINCCNRIMSDDFARITKPFRDSLVSLKLVTFSDAADEDALLTPLPPLPDADLPVLKILQLESVMPLRLLKMFSSSNIAALSLASMDLPSTDQLGEEDSTFVGVLEPFTKKGREEGLQALVLVEEDWEYTVLIKVCEWCRDAGIQVEIRAAGAVTPESVSFGSSDSDE